MNSRRYALMVVGATVLFSTSLDAMQVKQRNKEAIMKHVNSMLKDMKKAKTVNDAKLYDGYLKGYMKEQKKKDAKRKRSVRQTPGFLTSQEKKVTLTADKQIKKIQNKAKKDTEKISLNGIKEASWFEELYLEYENYMIELKQFEENLTKKDMTSYLNNAQKAVLESAKKIQKKAKDDLKKHSEMALKKFKEMSDADKIKKRYTKYFRNIERKNDLDFAYLDEFKFLKGELSAIKQELHTMLKTYDEKVSDAFEAKLSALQLNQSQKEDIEKAEEVLQEVTNRLADIDNIKKNKAKELRKKIQNITSKLQKIKTGDNVTQAKDVLGKLKTANNKLVTRYNAVKSFMENINRIFMEGDPATILQKQKEYLQDFTHDPEQQKFWGKIYNTLPGIIQKMLTIKQNLEKWQTIKRTSAHSSKAQSQAEFIKVQLEKKLVQEVALFHKAIPDIDTDKKSGLDADDAKKVIEKIYKGYEDLTINILKPLDLFIKNRNHNLRETASKDKNIGITNLSISQELTPLIDPLKKLADAELHPPISLMYAKRIKTIDDNIKTIRKLAQPTEK